MFWDICLLNHKTDYAASEELSYGQVIWDILYGVLLASVSIISPRFGC